MPEPRIPRLFMKFGNIDHMQMLQQGKLYMNTWQYFSNCESTAERMDMYEGVHEWLNPDRSDIFIEGYHLTKETGTINATVSFSDHRYIFCMCAIYVGDRIEIDGHIFDDRVKSFGEYFFAVINAKIFFDRLKACIEGLIKEKVISEARGRAIEYFDESTYDGEVGPFRKSLKYAHQKEWRLVVKKTGPEERCFIMDIGSIEDISVVGKTSDFINRIDQENDILNFRILK